MQITGAMLLGAQAVRGESGEMRAFAPALGQEIEPSFGLGGKAEVARACELAAQAFDAFRAAPHETRAIHRRGPTGRNACECRARSR